jgi:ParB family transcriptional regulator, chromosome partitioning protein
MVKRASPLQEINPDAIRPNPDNPRLIFREEEMNELMQSIKEVGVKVPISVYADGNQYVLLDGERRWRCSKRLNIRSIPAIVQPKPTRLENLLMMFNIHNVRVDWDVMPMALKLGEIRDMLASEGKDTSPKALAAITGLRLATVRRAIELLELPEKYQRMLLREAEKPRNEQRIKVDLFIEIYKSLHVIERYAPEVFNEISTEKYVEAMVDKYVSGVVDNVVSFREVSKIARAERAGVNKEEALPVILKLVKQNDYSIKDAFQDTVQAAYELRDLAGKARALAEKLSKYKRQKQLGADTLDALYDLRNELNRLLKV